jgi:CheY-like chemotaxis protein
MRPAAAAPILIVDDDPHDVLFLKEAFARLKLVNPLRECGTAEDAIQFLEHTRPALIITDVYLPLQSGIDLLKWLRSQADGVSHVPVIVLTGSNERIHEMRATDLHALMFLRKPIDSTTFLDAVRGLGLVVSQSANGRRGERVIESRSK